MQTAGRERDKAILAAVRAGSAVKDLAALTEVSVQAIYQALERAEGEKLARRGSGYEATLVALADYAAPQRFEQLVTILLAEVTGDLRPTQRSGDRGRDAVAGIYQGAEGEDLVVTISLQEDWARKVRGDMKRIADQGLRPKHVSAVTNRKATETKLAGLYAKASEYGWTLTVYDRDWIAAQVMRPDRVHLRTEFLHLPEPRPSLFLHRDEFARMLGDEAATTFVGRESLLATIEGHLAGGDVVIVDGSGGMGKSRLLLELTGRPHDWRPMFVRDGLPFTVEMLQETDAGDDVTVIIDDAHRRPDLRGLLAGLERRSPRPRLVLICRSGFDTTLREALDGLAFGASQRVSLTPLPRAEMSAMLEAPPLSIRLEGLRLAIVELAEGNPQIATIAARIAGDGLPVHELSQNELLHNYASRLLVAASKDSPDRLAIIALVAAVGQLSLSRETLAKAGELVGLPWRRMRRELEDLAEHGMLVQQGEAVQIKPDVLAEHILVGSFFDRKWRPSLDYDEVFDAFAATSRTRMLTVLGQALHSATEDARASATLEPLTRELLTAAHTSEEPKAAAEALALVSPGLPAVAAQGFDLLLERVDDAGLPDVSTELLNIATRIPLDAGWPRMLALAERVFGASGLDDPIADSTRGADAWTVIQHELGEAFDGLHARLPTQMSPDDARVLAAVHELLTLLTTAWWRQHRGRPGAAPTALLAARTMLRVIYEVTTATAASLSQVRMVAVGVAADDSTRRCLAAGLHVLLECLPALTLRGQTRALEVLRGLAHPALDGMTGPFGLELSEVTRALINDLFETIVVPWAREHLSELPLPAAAGVVDLFEWRTYFKQPVVSFDLSDELCDYRELIQHGEQWDLLNETIADQRERLARTADRFAEQLMSGELRVILARWSEWDERFRRATGFGPGDETLAMTFEALARKDLDPSIDAIDSLVTNVSPLIISVSPAMAVVVAERPEYAERWAEATRWEARRALAWATPSVKDEDVQQAVFTRLAADPVREVRAAAARALRHRTSLSGWRAETAVRVAVVDDDLRILYDLLRTLADRGEELPDPKGVEAALMRVAIQPVRDEGHLLARVFDALDELGVTPPLWAWVWRRLEFAAETNHTERAFVKAIPDALRGQLSRSATEPGRESELVRALEWLDQQPAFVVELALLDLIALFEDHDRIAAYVAAWATDDSGRRLLVRKLLENVHRWDRYERLAAATLAANPSPEMISLVVRAREPMSFVGSQVGYYESAREPFRAWSGHSDGNLVRAAAFAEQHFENRITEAKAREAQYLESYL